MCSQSFHNSIAVSKNCFSPIIAKTSCIPIKRGLSIRNLTSYHLTNIMAHISIQYFKSPFGELILGDYENALCLCDWRYRKMRESVDKRLQEGLNATYFEEDTELLQATKTQLTEYAAGERTEFDIPLLFVGTEFQKTVWEELVRIPYGSTESYLRLSQKLGNEKAIRAVASANGANAISILVPCHRIVGSQGELTGYAGGIPAKKKLLQLESKGKYDEQMELF